MFLLYAGFTLVFTARRVLYQRRVNKLDSGAKSQLADSLINYDTIKYFANEELEASRFSALMGRWTEAGKGNQRALFILHAGQSAVIGAGVAAIMLAAGADVARGAMSVGDLVLINAYALQVLAALSPDSVREAIGVVPQETVLFNDTVGYNIAYGRTGSSQAQLEAACKAAHVHELIASLPQGYATQVGERGVKMSGGEKQRSAIARAILKNPTILIFDEATSALDSDSEHAIQLEPDRLSQDRTTLIIAHRLSTIVRADEIIVTNRGRIVERGAHHDLLRRRGLYARLWLLQQRLGDTSLDRDTS